ncbi:MAG TPA: nucleotidyltransferase [bacterium]|nr:nucleotidyltransferase [bacterium]
MKITAKTTIKDLALIVCGTLKKNGIDAVLTGGAVVSIYTGNRYRSNDLDFISSASMKAIEAALAAIGFTKNKGRYFTHHDTELFVEFPSPPLSVGDRPVREFNEITTRSGYLKLLTPTHCVMDRLAAFYFWNDRQSLEQAVMVARAQSVDMKEIGRWSKVEKMTAKFEEFKAAV